VLRLDLGLGEIQVLVPDDMCVTTDASIGAGAADTGGGEQGGIDIDVEERRIPAPGVDVLHIEADIGIGAIRVGDRIRGDRFGVDDVPWRDDSLTPGTSMAACEAPA
jgi:hypothetical protein